MQSVRFSALFIPTLKEGGMTDEQLETMLVDNTREWLTPAG